MIEIMTHVKGAEREIAGARGKPDMRQQIYEHLYSKWFDELLGDYAFLREAQTEIAAHHEAAHSEAAGHWIRSGRRAWSLYWITLPISLVLGWFGSEVWEYLQKTLGLRSSFDPVGPDTSNGEGPSSEGALGHAYGPLLIRAFDLDRRQALPWKKREGLAIWPRAEMGIRSEVAKPPDQ